MKKSLLALAVLGAFTGVASAQSSLTIYGKVDQAFGHKAGAEISTWSDSGARSRLGFKGTEDLGGGLKANFVLEHSLNPDEGASKDTSMFWHGQSWVGLSHSTYGSLGVGRQYTAAFSLIQDTIDPFNGGGYAELRSMLLVNDDTGVGTKAGLTEVRYNNSLRYDYSGYGINAALSLGERKNDGVTFTNKETDRPLSAAVNYTMGALFVGAGVENPEGDGNYLVTLGAKYNMGFATVSAGYSTGTIDNAGTAAADVNGWLIGARVPFGKADLKVGYASSKIDGAESMGKLAIGVDYNLSKRTKVYADYARYSGDAVDGVEQKNAFLVGIQTNF